MAKRKINAIRRAAHALPDLIHNEIDTTWNRLKNRKKRGVHMFLRGPKGKKKVDFIKVKY